MHYKEESKDVQRLAKSTNTECRTTPTHAELKQLNLSLGLNTIVLSIRSHKTRIHGSVFLWNYTAKVVICDIDGTITKSDVGGHIMPIFGYDWVQPGIAQLLTAIHNNGYKVLYLSSRPIEMLTRTKKYLKRIKQDNCVLPNGPVIMSPNGIFESFTLEIIKRKPQEFKIPTLLSIQKLFPAAHNPFYAAYGNRNTDVISYISAGIKVMNVYIISKDGIVLCQSKPSPTTYAKLFERIAELYPKISD